MTKVSASGDVSLRSLKRDNRKPRGPLSTRLNHWRTTPLLHQHVCDAIEGQPPVLTGIILAFIGKSKFQIGSIKCILKAHRGFSAVRVIRLLNVEIPCRAIRTFLYALTTEK